MTQSAPSGAFSLDSCGTAVITGAASGIGRALADALHRRGFRVVLADLDRAGLDQVAARTGGTPVVTDVADPAAMQSLRAAAGDVTLVCLNAGVVGTALGAPWEVPADDWARTFDVNVGGVVNGLRAFVPGLLASGRPAHILVTASLAGLLVFPGGGAYGPSKHAVAAVVEHAAMALRDTAVSISMICPALVRTAMSADGVDPDDLASDALAAIENGVFTLVPELWHPAMIRHAEHLGAGQIPDIPIPDA